MKCCVSSTSFGENKHRPQNETVIALCWVSSFTVLFLFLALTISYKLLLGFVLQ